MKLTDAIIRKAQPQDKPYRLTDDHGLFLHVSTAGTKTWRLRFRKGGKDTAVTIGEYPFIGLKAAREAVIEILAEGKGAPVKKEPVAPLFSAVVEEWLTKKKTGLREATMTRILSAIRNDIIPSLGGMVISEIKPIDILNTIRTIEDRGAEFQPRRTLSYISQVMRYAVAAQYIPSDPSRDIVDALRKPTAGHYAAATTREMAAEVIKAVRRSQCALPIRLALEFTMLTFVRHNNVKQCRWEDIDLEKRVWHIPAENMKMGSAHDVPLSEQAIRILLVARGFGTTGVVFKSNRSHDGTISHSGIMAALRAVGVKSEDMTIHGFRSMASSLLNEAGEDPDVIEKQLAHKSGDSIRAIYNRAAYWEKRVKLMQTWADMVDELAK